MISSPPQHRGGSEAGSRTGRNNTPEHSYVLIVCVALATLAYIVAVLFSYDFINKGGFEKFLERQHPLVPLALYGTGPFLFLAGLAGGVRHERRSNGSISTPGCLIFMAGFVLLTAVLPLLVVFTNGKYQENFLFMFERDERAIRHREASRLLEDAAMGHMNTEYSEAARKFAELGDFKNSREKSRESWYRLGCSQFLGDNIERLEEAKKTFQLVADYKDSTRYIEKIDNKISIIQTKQKITDAMRDKEYDAAIALMESLNEDSLRMRDDLERARALRRDRAGMSALKRVLERAGAPASTLDGREFFDPALSFLFSGNSPISGNEQLLGAILAETRSYELIAHGLNELLWMEHKFYLGDGAGRNFPGGLHTEVLLAALIDLAESGDRSPEFENLLGFFRKVVVNDRASPFSKFTRFSSLIELYDAGPEWIPLCYPGDSRLAGCDTQGTIEYRVLHGPRAIKDALYNQAEDTTGSERFIRTYTQEEVKRLFTGFVPSKPLKTGYIYIMDFGEPPEGLTKLGVSALSYETQRHADVTYLPDSFSKTQRRKELESDRRFTGLPKHAKDQILFEEAQKPKPVTRKMSARGGYFLVANPNNARITICERYRYVYFGKYTIEGNGGMVDLYIPSVDITVTDLVSGKTLLTDTVSANPDYQYSVPSGTKPGDVFAPFDFFDRKEYICRKLDGLID